MELNFTNKGKYSLISVFGQLAFWTTFLRICPSVQISQAMPGCIGGMEYLDWTTSILGSPGRSWKGLEH